MQNSLQIQTPPKYFSTYFPGVIKVISVERAGGLFKKIAIGFSALLDLGDQISFYVMLTV